MSHASRYASVMALTILTCLLEFLGSHNTNSLGLLSDALHLVADNVPLYLGALAYKIHTSGKNTDWVEKCVTWSNIILLFVVGICMGAKTLDRYAEPQVVDASMLPYAIGACVGNFAQFYLARGLVGAHKHTHTGKGQVLHLGVDFLASLGIVAGALTLRITGSPYADVGAAAVVVLASFLAALHLSYEVLFHEHHH